MHKSFSRGIKTFLVGVEAASNIKIHWNRASETPPD